MKKIVKFSIMTLLAINLTSCYTTRTTIGSGPVGRDQHVMTYSKSKQFYLFAGLIPMGRNSAVIPPDKNCQIKSKFTLFDLILSSVTLSIISARTTQVLVHDVRE